MKGQLYRYETLYFYHAHFRVASDLLRHHFVWWTGHGNDETSTCGDTTPAEETTAEPDRLDELGKHDFGGKKFTILDANDHPDWHVNIHGDSLNGDIVKRRAVRERPRD